MWFVVVAVVLGIAIAFGLAFARRRLLDALPTLPPSIAARRSLQAEINELRQRLGSRAASGDPMAAEVHRARQVWWQRQLSETELSTLSGKGLSKAALSEFQRQRIVTFADFQRVANRRLPGISDRQMASSRRAFEAKWRELELQSNALSWEQLDALSGGAIARVRSTMRSSATEKQRQDEDLRCRLNELERRLNDVQGKPAPPIDAPVVQVAPLSAETLRSRLPPSTASDPALLEVEGILEDILIANPAISDDEALRKLRAFIVRSRGNDERDPVWSWVGIGPVLRVRDRIAIARS